MKSFSDPTGFQPILTRSSTMTAWPSSSSAFLPASTSVWLKLLPTLGWLTMMSTFFLPSAAAGNGFEKFASNAMAEGSKKEFSRFSRWISFGRVG